MKALAKELKDWTIAIFIAFSIAWFIRIFVVQGFFIPSQSMEPTLQSGDFIFISKYSYGARMPITPIAIPFMHQNMPFSSYRKAYWDKVQFPYLRTSGFAEVKRNDVMVFNYPMETERPIDKRSYYVKRCIGLPGDTLKIVAKKVYINGERHKEEADLLINRKVRSSIELTPEWMDSVGISEGGKLSNLNDYLFPLTDSMTNDLRMLEYIYDVDPIISKKGEFHAHVFPNTEILAFNADHFGPVIVPHKGMNVLFNDTTIALYGRIIEVYEKQKLSYAAGEAYIDGVAVDSYTFEMDYFFVLGDNRDQSADSRFWGFVPENHLVGKALFIGFSYNKFAAQKLKIRWDRFFKSIK